MSVQLRVETDWLHTALSESIERYENLRVLPVNTAADRMALLAAFRSWDERNKRLLDQAFTPVPWHESSPKSEYADLKDVQFSLLEELETTEQATALGRLADEKRRRLESLRDSLDLFQSSSTGPAELEAADGSVAADVTRTIFLVHGRDKSAREEVHRFLDRILEDAKVTVLAEQPNQGQTLVEKLEAHLPGAGYAIVSPPRTTRGDLEARKISRSVRDRTWYLNSAWR